MPWGRPRFSCTCNSAGSSRNFPRMWGRARKRPGGRGRGRGRGGETREGLVTRPRGSSGRDWETRLRFRAAGRPHGTPRRPARCFLGASEEARPQTLPPAPRPRPPGSAPRGTRELRNLGKGPWALFAGALISLVSQTRLVMRRCVISPSGKLGKLELSPKGPPGNLENRL